MTPKQPSPDRVLTRIADYVTRHEITRRPAYEMARYCLLDALGCALDAQAHPECTKLLGPIVPRASLPNGVRVPGTGFKLDPVKAAFDISTAIRWLEYNDTWFGTDGGHPSDNLGAVLAVADYVSRNRAAGRRHALTVGDVLTALIKAYEIQGVLLLKNNFIELGLDSVGLVTVASAAVATHLLGGSRHEIMNALSNAWLDGISPRLYRIGHNAGWRKAWAAGDAASRGVMHGLFALRGEMGYPAALSTPRWGVCDVLLRGKPIVIDRAFDSYIVEHILFKIPFPAHFHTQTASECALKLRPLVKDRIADIKTIRLRTHEKTLQSAYKEGPLHSPASRDHCVQYVVAVVLLHGKLTADDYQDEAAADPRIDELRDRMVVTEDREFTRDFYDARKRTNSNAMRVEFRDGATTPEVRIDYPLGHPRRRPEGLPLVEQKFQRSVERVFSPGRRRRISDICGDLRRLETVPFEEFMDLFRGKRDSHGRQM